MPREKILQDVLRRIGAKTGRAFKPRGEWHDGRCPAHEDKHNSLSLRAGDVRVIFKCRAGCSEEAVAGAIGLKLSDLFYEQGKGASSGKPAKRRKKNLTLAALAKAKGFTVEFLKELGCREEDNQVVIEYRREDSSAAGRHRIRSAISAKDGSRWTGTSEDGAPTPYGLWRLIDARHGKYLILVEGETDCWALWRFGFPALGLPGATMVGKLAAKHLRGIEKVYVVREPDRGGIAFVQGLAKHFADTGFEGEALVVNCDPHKDPHVMFAALGAEGFEDAMRRRLNAAVPLSAYSDEPVDYQEANVADLFLQASPRPLLFVVENEENRDRLGTRILQHRGTLYEFDGRAYRELPDSELRARVTAFIRSRKWLNRKGDVAEAVPKEAFARNVILNITGKGCVSSEATPPVWKDGREAVRTVVLANGIMELDAAFAAIKKCGDLAKYELRAHTPDLFTLNAMPYMFEAKAECPTWQAFLDRVLPNPELQGVLQEFFGYCLIPTQKYEKILVLQGDGANGKSVTMRVLKRLIGERNCSAVDLEFLGEPHALQPMEGKLVNFATEWSHLKAGGAAILKKISGGDPATINPKGTKAYMTDINARFVISTNNPPSISDRSDAFWRRLLCLPFDVQIPLADQIPLDPFVATICEQLPGIFVWAMAGLYGLDRRGGFHEPKIMLELKEGHRIDSNLAAAWCDINLEVRDDERLLVTAVYDDYVAYCKAAGGKALNRTHFGVEIGRWFRRKTGLSLLKTRRGGKRMATYEGVGVIPTIPDSTPTNRISSLWSQEN